MDRHGKAIAVLTAPDATLAGTGLALGAGDLQYRIARPLVAARLACHDVQPRRATPFLSSFLEPHFDRPSLRSPLGDLSRRPLRAGRARARVAREQQRRPLAAPGLRSGRPLPCPRIVSLVLLSGLTYARSHMSTSDPPRAPSGARSPYASAFRVSTWFQSFQPSGGINRSLATPALVVSVAEATSSAR
jgi:hypothetical protein